MARIHLIRHGEAAARWDQDLDPGLSELGRAQAAAVAELFAGQAPLSLISSPLKRCRETSEPLAARWGVAPTIEPAVAEIPSPAERLDDRAAWLWDIMQGGWGQADASLEAWRRGVIGVLQALETDSVVFSHFVAINVAVGAATGDDRVLCFRPTNCAVTILDNSGGALSLIELGAEADTVVG